MTSRHRAHPMLFLLALLFRATTMIGPAVADTPATATPKANPTIYDEVRAGKPGALLQMQQENMLEILEEGLAAFGKQSGHFPSTAEEVINCGLIPFVPVEAAGSPMKIQALEQSELPSPNAVGMRCREVDTTIIQMGANGDLLSPAISTVEHPGEPSESWPYSYNWSRRLSVLMRTAAVRQISSAARLTGQLPTSPAELESTTRMVPQGCQWESMLDPSGIGVWIEIDTDGELLRATCYPDPGVITSKIHRFSKSATPSMSAWPLGLAQQRTWRSFGMLKMLSTPTLEFAPLLASAPAATEITRQLAPSWYPEPMIVAEEFARLGAWYLDLTGQPPTTQWLLDNNLTLHRLLTFASEPVELLSHAVPDPTKSGLELQEQAPAQPALSTVAEQVLLWTSNEYWRNLPAEIQEEVRLDGKLFPSIQLTQARYSRYQLTGYLRQDPLQSTLAPETIEALRALSPVLNEAPEALAGALWKELERLDTTEGFSYRYMSLAGSSMMRCLVRWQLVRPEESIPDWATILQDIGLAPRGYRILAQPQAPAPGEGWVELAASPDFHVYRLTMRHPSGLIRIGYHYLKKGNILESMMDPGTGRQAIFSPEFAALEYTPIATFAIPIPDPPVLPEVVTP